MPDALPLTLLDAALRGAVLALLCLLAASLWRDRPRLVAARLGVLMAWGLGLQVLSSTPLFESQVPGLWQAPLVAVSVANAVLFWVFVQALFNDDFRLRPLHLGAWLVVAGLSGLNCLLNPPAAATLPAWAAGLAGVQRAVPLVFAVLAGAAALAQWRSDLVEGRRRLRGFIVLTGVGYTLLMLAARLAAPGGHLSATTATLDVALLLLMVAVVAWRLLGLGLSDLFPASAAPLQAGPGSGSAKPAEVAGFSATAGAGAAPAPAQPAPDPAEARLAETLQRLMAEQRLYRSEDLSVASLAARLAVPEYRLRRLINQRLGHRNFSAFVNGWRLAEVRGALADPERRALPVLTLALEAGFQSIGPFNRAFKAATGLTPTEFRREKLADS